MWWEFYFTLCAHYTSLSVSPSRVGVLGSRYIFLTSLCSLCMEKIWLHLSCQHNWASECWKMNGSKIYGENEGAINCQGLSSSEWHCRFFISFVHRFDDWEDDKVELGNSMQERKDSDPNHLMVPVKVGCFAVVANCLAIFKGNFYTHLTFLSVEKWWERIKAHLGSFTWLQRSQRN